MFRERKKSGFLSACGTTFEIFRAVVNDVLAAGGDDESVRLILVNNDLRKQMVELIMSYSKASVQQCLEEWTEFYKKFFDADIDFSDIEIPEKQPGFNRLIIVAKGLTLNRAYGKCTENFPCSRYTDDLDKVITENDRGPREGSYAIWIRDRVEADEELKNLSGDNLREKNIQGITLLERMLYELKYWSETGKHLDIQNWTLCSGSRDSGGNVPGAYWDGVEFRVYWGCASDHDGSLRSRSVVS